jgi:hypothetical protein
LRRVISLARKAIRQSPRAWWRHYIFDGSGCIVLPALRFSSFARHCEEQSDEAIHSFFVRRDGLLRFARNGETANQFVLLSTRAPFLII